MITVTKYICDFCGTEYDTSAACSLCEESHVSVNEIDDAVYAVGKKYPTLISVVFDDDHVVRYSYASDLGIADGGSQDDG